MSYILGIILLITILYSILSKANFEAELYKQEVKFEKLEKEYNKLKAKELIDVFFTRFQERKRLINNTVYDLHNIGFSDIEIIEEINKMLEQKEFNTDNVMKQSIKEVKKERQDGSKDNKQKRG